MTRFFENKRVKSVGVHVIEKSILTEVLVDFLINQSSIYAATTLENLPKKYADKISENFEIHKINGIYRLVRLKGSQMESIPMICLLSIITGGTNYNKISENDSEFILEY